MVCAPRSLSASSEKLFSALEAEHGSAYLLDLDLSVRYVNQAWVRSLQTSGGAGAGDTGEPVPRFFDGATPPLFPVHFARVIASNQPWSSVYERATPEPSRKFRVRAAPTAQRDGLIVVHSRVVDVAPGRIRETLGDLVRAYTDERGLLVQCSGCHRIRHPAESSWDWAPQVLTREPENLSHGICSICDFQYYW